MHNSVIKSRNVIKRIDSFILENNSSIVSSNHFIGTSLNLKRNLQFSLGEGSVITSNHYFDFVDNIILGSNVVIAGNQTQIWTHGFDVKRNMISAPITLGNNIYIGSRCLILLGVEICDNVSIGAGTCVSRSISESGFYVSQNLLRKADCQSFENDKRLVL